MELNIALLAGDGIGPEVIEQAVKVSNAIAKKINHSINSLIFTINKIITMTFSKICNIFKTFLKIFEFGF